MMWRGAQRGAHLVIVLAAAGAGLLSLACAIGGSERPAWEQPPPPVHTGAVVRPGTLTRHTLAWGLEVLILEDHRLPRVSMGVRLRRGGATEDLSEAGLSVYTAELMERGAGDRDALVFAETIDAIGARLSVSAGWDSFGISIAGLSRDVDLLFELLRDVVLAPRFDEVEAEKARSAQLAVLARAPDDPGTLLARALAATLYPGHRYGIPLIGNVSTVRDFDSEAARRFHAKHVLSNNAILFITGDIDPVVWVRKVGEVFGDWRPGPVVNPVAPPPREAPVERQIVIVDRPDLVQAQISIAHEGLDRLDERRIAASLMNAVLGGSGFSSRLMQRIRSDAGLVYGVGSGFSLRRRPGPFRIGTATRVSAVRRTLDLVLEEMAAIREQRSPSHEERIRAASYRVGQFALSLENSEQVIGSLVNLAIYGLPDDSLDTFRTRVAAVTTPELGEMARELLHPERVVIAVVGPAAELAPALESLGRVRILAPAEVMRLQEPSS